MDKIKETETSKMNKKTRHLNTYINEFMEG